MIHCLIKLVKLFNLILFIFYLSLEAQAKEPLFIGTTTSTHDSGLIMHLRKIFEIPSRTFTVVFSTENISGS